MSRAVGEETEVETDGGEEGGRSWTKERDCGGTWSGTAGNEERKRGREKEKGKRKERCERRNTHCVYCNSETTV